MPGHHGGGHHGHYGHHGRGRRRFGGYGYGYGGWWPYGYAIPCYRYDEFGNCIDPEIVGMDEHALAGPLALASIPYGVGADPAPSAAPSAPAEGQLVQLSSLLTAPSAVPAKVEMDLQGDQLTVAVQIDGKIYRGTADLSQIFDTAKTYLEAYHEALHRRGTMLVGADGDGCAPSAAQAAEPIAKDVIDRACTLLVGALCDQHRRAHAALCAGFFDDISHAVSSAASGIAHVAEGAVKEAGKTLSKLKGPIATAAAGAAASAAMAIPGAGPLVAPLAGSLANNLVNAAVGGGDVGKAAQRVVRQAKQAAQTNPQIAHALDTAHQAVAQATAGYHTAQTFANAALGDVNAQAQIDQLVAAADAGNANASAVLMVADGAAQQLEANLPDDLAAADAAAVAQPYGDGDAAVQGIIHGGAPKARMLVGASARELASAAAQQFPSRAVGIVQTIDGNWQLQGFPDADAADDWYGSWLSMPHAFAYVAYYDKADPSFPAGIRSRARKRTARASGGTPLRSRGPRRTSHSLGCARGPWIRRGVFWRAEPGTRTAATTPCIRS